MICSLTMDGFSGLVVDNKKRVIRRLAPRPTEDSVVSSQNQFNRTKPEIEAMVVSATQKGNFPREYILTIQEPYVLQRNEILDNPLKYYNPVYRARLRKIDAKLDEIDASIGALESSNIPSESDLKSVIIAAEARLTECFKALTRD